MTAIMFHLNGAPVAVRDAAPTTTLLEYLRGRPLPGTKEGCAEGDCGACTVILRTPAGDGLATRAVNACIMPLPMAHGAEVITVEGLDDHPVQREMAARHASQCGFCTPGFVMALAARPPGAPADRAATEERLAGNLCRCTGYGPILAAAEASADDADARADPAADAATAATLTAIPPLDYTWNGRHFLAPTSEAAFAEAAARDPVILAGATDVGLWITKRLFDPVTILSTLRVRELATIEERDGALIVGAAVTHTAFHAAIRDRFPALGELMQRFAGLQVRNAGTVGGNIANASPIGDLPPAFIAAGATLELGHHHGRRTLPLEDYFLAYGSQDRRAGEYVRAVHLPLDGLARLTCHKVSKRFQSDITAVLGCFALRLDGDTVAEARLAYGGMAGIPARARYAEAAMVGRPYSAETVAAAGAALAQDFAPLTDLRASAAYRLRIAANLLRRDHLERTGTARTRLAGEAGAGLAA